MSYCDGCANLIRTVEKLEQENRVLSERNLKLERLDADDFRNAEKTIVALREARALKWKNICTPRGAGSGDDIVAEDGTLICSCLLHEQAVSIVAAHNALSGQPSQGCQYCKAGHTLWYDEFWMHTVNGSNVDCENPPTVTYGKPSQGKEPS